MGNSPVATCTYEPTPAPKLPEYRCCRHLLDGSECGARLHPVATKDRLDWTYADDSGSTTHDETPAELVADPKKWWANLAEKSIETYSALTAAINLRCFSWWHLHAPAPIPGHDYGPVPQTCGKPMWSGPDGWVCRTHWTVFPYATEEDLHA